jgi:hypothetical protein
LNTSFQTAQRLVLARQASSVVDRAICIIPILCLDRENLVLEARILGSQGLAQTLTLLHLGAWHKRTSGALDDGKKEQDRTAGKHAKSRNHSFRFLSGTKAIRTHPARRSGFPARRLESLT